MEAHATNVFAGLELLRAIHVVAGNFKFHHAPMLQSHFITMAQMVVNDCRQTLYHADNYSFRRAQTASRLFHDITAFHFIVMDGLSLILTKSGKRGLVFFDDFVFHI